MANLSKAGRAKARGNPKERRILHEARCGFQVPGFRTLIGAIPERKLPFLPLPGLGRPLFEQVRPPLPRALEGARPAPPLDPAMVARQEDVGHRRGPGTPAAACSGDSRAGPGRSDSFSSDSARRRRPAPAA